MYLKFRQFHLGADNIVAACSLVFFLIVAIGHGNACAQDNRSEGQKREILDGLERGANALRALGRNDEAAYLIEIAKQLNQPAENRDRLPERAASDRNQADRAMTERQMTERQMTERQMAERQLDVFRMAHHAFREAEKGDAIELVERIIHGREFQLADRRDEEAQQAIRNMPGREDQIELLTRASGIWKEFGNMDKSQALTSLADQMRQRENRSGNAARTETREQPAREQPARGRQVEEREVNRDRQMEQIHGHLMRMSEQIELLQKQLNEIRDKKQVG